jgi:putative transposase
MRFASLLEDTDAQSLAWSMMSNHYHLLLRAGARSLSRLMHKLLGGYAGSYNRRHRRVGVVFQNRFKSVLCDEESYLMELVRYIHLNPVRARLVANLESLDRYLWTGHGVLMGMPGYDWQNTNGVLERFGATVSLARRHYRTFIADGLGNAKAIDYSGGGLIRSSGGWEAIRQARGDHERRIGDERILGDSQFVERALDHDCLEIEARARRLQSGWDLPRLIEAVCSHFDIEATRIADKGRGNDLSAARSVVCYLGASELGLRSTEIGAALRMSYSAVSRASRRGCAYCAKHGITVDRLAEINGDCCG